MRKILTFLLMLILVVPVFAQPKTITGTITDAGDGSGIPGATIQLKGTQTGTISNLDGFYSLSIDAVEQATLIFSFVGYSTQQIVVGDESEINVALKIDALNIDEVVVVGYGTQKKSLITGAIAKVDADQLTESANLRIEQALQGKTAGVTITSTSGQPGEDLTVRIRGIGTTGNSDPLYIVDGMPAGGISYLNNADIESVEILKDAASTSIYGSRGANGVVLVTTKQGKAGHTEITYDSYYGVQNPWQRMSMLNAEEYAIIMNEASANAGRAPMFANPAELGEGTDWTDEIFYYKAPITNHNVGISGGNENSTYSTSFSYFSQDGIVGEGKSNFERYSYRINSQHKYKKLRFGNNFAYSYIKKSGISPNEEFGQPLAGALNLDPITKVENEDGTWGESAYIAQEIVNPVAQLSTINTTYRENKFIGNVFGIYEILPGLTFNSNFGIDLAYGLNDTYTPVYRLNASVQNTNSKAFKDMTKWFTWQWENTLAYEKSLGDHYFKAMLGTTSFEHIGETLGGSKQDLIFTDFEHSYINTGTNEESEQAFGAAWHSALNSYFGRINYSYEDKYMITAVLRADGSSKFGENNRYAYFPSFSIGWVLSREAFLENNSMINFMKLRARWGQNGNQEIGDYMYTSAISSASYYTLGIDQLMVVGSQPDRIPNPDLRWETSQQTDVGLDMGIFNNRVSIALDYYNKETIDLLVEAPIPGYVGNDAPFVNGGTVVNKGFEFEVSYRNNFAELNYDLSLSGAFNTNEVTAIDNAEGIIHGAGVATAMNDVCRAEVGKPIGYFWGYQTDGIFQNQAEIDTYNKNGVLIQPNAKPGDFIFKDNNDDGKIDNLDRTMLGNPTPDFTLGLNFALDYKGFDFSAFFYGAFGHQIFNGIRRYDLPAANWNAKILDRWTGEGTSNDIPRVTLDDANQNFSRPSDYYVEDATFVRLKNISLGYSLPKTTLEKIGLSKLRFYVSAQNLITLSGYTGSDPEIGAHSSLDIGIDRSVYPQAKVFLMGINIAL